MKRNSKTHFGFWSRFPLQVLACKRFRPNCSCGLSVAIGASLITSLRRINFSNYLAIQSMLPLLFGILLLQTSCKKDPKVVHPSGIDFSQNFIDHTKAGSFWQYTSTSNEDTLTSSPANIFKLEGDSIIKGEHYKVLALTDPNGNIIPMYIYRFVLNTIYEPRYFDADSTIILEAPIVDLNRDLNETWTVETSSNFKQILSIDSINFKFNGLENVFRVVSENYWDEVLISNGVYYYQAKTGLVQRQLIDAITGSKFIVNLSDSKIEY